MKGFRKTKERVLGFVLAFVMVVSIMAGGNMFEVKAEESNTYAPYYDVEQNKVCGAPDVGTRISPTDIFSAENLLDDEVFEWKVYYTENGARYNSEYPGLCYVIFDNQTTQATGLGTSNERHDWIVTNVYFEEKVQGDFNKSIVVEGYSVEAPTIISPTVSFDWNGLSTFTIGESVPNVEDELVSVTGESIEDIFTLGLQIKATMQHVAAGYITESMYSDAESGWISAEKYSSDYKINNSDVYGYAFELQTEWINNTYRVLALAENADIKNNITVTTKGVVVDVAYAYSCYTVCDFAMVYLNLGTGADIVEAINPSTQEPTTPPTTGGEVVFTDETADAILEASEIIVNAKCENVWESTENDPYAYPVYVKTNADGSKEYELGNSDDAEAYIRIDYTYTMVDGTELTWLENYTDATHPNSMYDKSYPIVLKDGDGNIYVDMTSYGMSEGSFDETIGVVPKEIYDGYMDWLIGKLTGGGSNTPTDKPVTPPTTDNEEATIPPTTNTKNDHEAQLENKTDVETKIELTEDEKTAIASGEELEIVLVFKDAGTKADNDEKKAIEKQLGDNSLGVFLDIELIKKIGSTEVEVSETKGLVTITFEMPEELKNKDASVTRTYKVMRYHDGKVDELDAKYDVKTGKLSFETDKFSTYAVVYNDTKVNNTTTSTPAPQTGDATNAFVYIALLGLALCSILVVLRKQGLRNSK